jgi:hypothetical protein
MMSISELGSPTSSAASPAIPQRARTTSRRDRNHPLKHRGGFGSSMTAEKISDMMLA